jgi:hypothetical protein
MARGAEEDPARSRSREIGRSAPRRQQDLRSECARRRRGPANAPPGGVGAAVATCWSTSTGGYETKGESVSLFNVGNGIKRGEKRTSFVPFLLPCASSRIAHRWPVAPASQALPAIMKVSYRQSVGVVSLEDFVNSKFFICLYFKLASFLQGLLLDERNLKDKPRRRHDR